MRSINLTKIYPIDEKEYTEYGQPLIDTLVACGYIPEELTQAAQDMLDGADEKGFLRAIVAIYDYADENEITLDTGPVAA